MQDFVCFIIYIAKSDFTNPKKEQRMMKKWLFSMMLLAGFLSGCSNNDEDGRNPDEQKVIELSRSEQVMAEEATDFAFRFFQQVNESEKAETNWMVSPLSASMALGMMTNGADGNTLAEMKATLGFSEASIDEMNAYYRRLLTELPDLDNTTQLRLANSIWINEEFGVKSPFVDVNKQMYDAQVTNLDFSSPNATSTINNWCSEKTNGLITKALEKINPDAEMFLLNALYFKGIWKKGYKFLKENTQEGDFTCADGSIVQVPMMHQTNSFKYTSNEYFQIARFDYGNGSYGMTILLPNEELTLDKSLEALTFKNWKEWSKEYRSQKLQVKFPHLDIKYKKDLIGDMNTLGIKDAFNSSADFSGISSERLYLSLFEQFIYLKVDEEGTEAAAVTIGGLSNSVDTPTPLPIEFHLNRPFAFMITENSTGAVLFMGKVTKF